jgi:hypothetical protein
MPTWRADALLGTSLGVLIFLGVAVLLVGIGAVLVHLL